MEKTIFEKIIDREIPAEIVYENEHILAFKDIMPQAPIHVLVIPKNKVTGFSLLKDLSVEENGNFLKGISLVVESLNVDKKGYRIVFNSGKYGQQTVEYLHAHILGERQLQWPPG